MSCHAWCFEVQEVRKHEKPPRWWAIFFLPATQDIDDDWSMEPSALAEYHGWDGRTPVLPFLIEKGLVQCYQVVGWGDHEPPPSKQVEAQVFASPPTDPKWYWDT